MGQKINSAGSWRKWPRMLAMIFVALPVMAKTGGPSSPPPTVAFCDLVSNPQAFDGQWIRVRGQVSLAFEDFTLHESGCDKPLTRNLWLMYGGDEETPITYCCGDHSRPKGKDIIVRGQSISLLRDAEMDDFIAKVRARRARRVNGEPCDTSACNLYRVSADIVGLFLAARNDARNPLSGFGHMGCCHLLVIHQVSNVVAERTAVPEEEGGFNCSKQTWQAEFPSVEGNLLDPQTVNKKFLAQQMRLHGDAELVDVMQNTISKYSGVTGTLVWASPDLMTTYWIPFPRTRSGKGKQTPSAQSRMTTVTRERCVAIQEGAPH